jgi:hypothetical protein
MTEEQKQELEAASAALVEAGEVLDRATKTLRAAEVARELQNEVYASAQARMARAVEAATGINPRRWFLR